MSDIDEKPKAHHSALAPAAEATPAVDVLRPVGPTQDGCGMHVLRARDGHVELGELRALEQGKPLSAGEVVKLTQRGDAPALYDVEVEYASKPRPLDTRSSKPAQVATNAYRANWDRVFTANANGIASVAVDATDIRTLN
jgi:hypothetical protein